MAVIVGKLLSVEYNFERKEDAAYGSNARIHIMASLERFLPRTLPQT